MIFKTIFNSAVKGVNAKALKQVYTSFEKFPLAQGSSTFRVRGSIYIFHIILRTAVIADYKIIMDILHIIIGAWAARQVT